MNALILKLSKAIDNSKRYKNTKSFFRSLLIDIHYPYKKYFDAFMIALIMCSIAILILGKSGKIPEWFISFDLYVITFVFALEYLLRLWMSHDVHSIIIAQHKVGQVNYWNIVKLKLRYMVSLPALIDLVAIFPKFRILRLLKLYHYMHGASSLFDALLKKRFEFQFLGYMLFTITFTLGSIFYLLEYGVNKNIVTYLDAIYWALVTISTVGYGDIAPVTEVGKVVSMFGIIFGIAMISFVTSVMVSAFSERFDELRNHNSLRYVNKMQDVVIINGYGHLGITIAKKLKNHKVYNPVIIEDNEEKVAKALVDGYTVIQADASSANIIEELYKKDNIAALLTLKSSDIDNIYFILNAKSTYSAAVVFSRMNQAQLKAQYTATKVDGTVETHEIVNSNAFNYLLKHSSEDDQSISFFGYSHKSITLCQMFKDKGISVNIYDLDELAIEKAKKDGFNHVYQIDRHHDYVKLLNHNVVVCAMEDESLNVYVGITLRANAFKGEIIALSDSTEDNRKLYLAGVSKIFDMYDESASQFIEMIEKQSENEGKII